MTNNLRTNSFYACASKTLMACKLHRGHNSFFSSIWKNVVVSLTALPVHWMAHWLFKKKVHGQQSIGTVEFPFHIWINAYALERGKLFTVRHDAVETSRSSWPLKHHKHH